jgi:large subunit ribosomal protein L29
MKVFELREKSREELTDILNGLYKEVFNLRLRRGAQELPNPLRLRTLRRDIARIKTVMREDELNIRKVLDTQKEKTQAKAKPKAKKKAGKKADKG